jgi:hypothetical protein
VETIQTILSKLNLQFLEGAKVLHGLSNPVLRQHDGRVVIAVFGFVYEKAHFDANQLPRPAYWMTAGLETGEPAEEIDCLDRDFSEESFDGLYSMENPGAMKASQEAFEALFALFDSVRDSLVTKGVPDMDKYAEYMDKMLALAPPAYHVFYRELDSLGV